MPNIIVKNYEHYNRAMGKYITSKKHYENEMAKGGYVPYEQCQQQVANTLEKQKYKGVSEKTEKFCHQVKSLADKKGNIQWSNKLIKGLKEHGVDYTPYTTLPKHYRVDLDTDKGGITNGK